MKRIYRVETPDGRGPYMNGRKPTHLDSACAAHRPMPYHDGIDEDVIFDLGKVRRYGFSDLSALKRWFTPRDRAILLQHSYRIGVYDVGRYWEGHSQVIFDATSARRIGSLSLFHRES